ncbi:HD domain-containing protein [Bacillus cereus group sp. TH204-1LC]|uniref:HD domain-containing protein n=1 Tax=unclassified Bacillus cereus group TaxID=2750818 RepID=UPI0018F3742F|nr:MULTISPECIES: HD domain-containing protein [unclassified Bacillus cereus group]MBJ8109018.1 HD domain-containing protein [Bacillus cereus group sp. N6]MDA1616228.1 HD domain-containing protein [Bacillus cereus group sp. TH204-1LC]
MSESRVRLFEQRMADAGQVMTLRALDMVKEEMCATKGFARHDGTDYYNHCVDVAQDLFNHGYRDENLLSAGLLHDIVEDVDGITLRMIEDKFNPRVAKLVDLVTKEKSVNYKEGELLKVLYLEPILRDPDASLLKTADRKHNFSTLRDAIPEKKIRQAIETEKFFFPFFKEAMKRYPRHSAYFLSAKTAIKPHLMEILEHYEEVNALNLRIAELEAQLNKVPVLQ